MSANNDLVYETRRTKRKWHLSVSDAFRWSSSCV